MSVVGEAWGGTLAQPQENDQAWVDPDNPSCLQPYHPERARSHQMTLHSEDEAPPPQKSASQITVSREGGLLGHSSSCRPPVG